jgi:hypothetical protein
MKTIDEKTNVLQIIELNGPFRPKVCGWHVTSIHFDSGRVAVHSQRPGDPCCIREHTQLSEHRGDR